ncbi:MAG TPA: DUF1840 domain-containing protein [Burkholderiaceae bacterium]|nr:DUF1840 domain-containing protein [Burkholderiaceae bacterium]
MALVTFRSPAASAIIMYSQTAQQLLEIMGRPLTERGVITSEQVDEALARLEQAVQNEKPAATPADEDDKSPVEYPVSLRQRAFPLVQMLRAARKRHVDVTWGI